jgi:hypothetical protein
MQPGSLVRTRKPGIGIPKGSIGLVTRVDEIPTCGDSICTVSLAAPGPRAPQRYLGCHLEVISEGR